MPPDASPVLLLEGDHELSLKWRTDEQFREQFKVRA